MKWNWKRPVAFLLSFAMMAGTLQGALSLPVFAAPEVKVYFVDRDGGNPTIEATRMVGNDAGNASAFLGLTVDGVQSSDYQVSRIITTAQDGSSTSEELANKIVLGSDKKTININPDTPSGIYNILVKLNMLSRDGLVTETFGSGAGGDTTPPSVDGSKGAQLSNDLQSIVLAMSENVDVESRLSTTIFGVSDGTTTVNIANVTANGSEITITFANPLDNSKTYTLTYNPTVVNYIADDSGNIFSAGFTNMQVKKAIDPTISSETNSNEDSNDETTIGNNDDQSEIAPSTNPSPEDESSIDTGTIPETGSPTDTTAPANDASAPSLNPENDTPILDAPISQAKKLNSFFANAGGSFTLDSSRLIDQDSRMTLTLRRSGNTFSFDNVSGTQTFAGYTTCVLNTTAPSGGIEDKDNDGGSKIYVRFSGNGVTSFTASFDSAQTKNMLRDGTLFEVKFEQLGTHELTLKLKNPQDMVNEIAENIKDETLMREYIIYKDGDRNNFVTGDIQLLHKKEFSGMPDSVANIEWVWKANPGELPDGKTDADIIRIPANDSPLDWFTATVTQQDERDVTGTLTAIVTYKPQGGGSLVTADPNKTPVITITVKKRGKSPLVDTIERTVIESDSGVSYVNAKIPAMITMDCYKGDILPQFPKTSDNPYTFKGYLYSGTGTRFCSSVRISADDNTVVGLRYMKNNEEIDADLSTETTIPFEAHSDDADWEDKIEYNIYAKADGTKNTRSTNVTFSFYREGGTEPYEQYTTNIKVTDSSPSSDTSLKNLEIRQYKNGNLIDNLIQMVTQGNAYDWEFNPEQTAYDLTFSYKTDYITLKPTRNENHQTMTITYTDDDGIEQTKELVNGANSEKIPLELNVPRKITITVKSESGIEGTYDILATRRPPSDDATLSSLQVYDSADAEATDLMNPAFSNSQNEYTITVPYQTDKVLVKVVPTDNIGAEIEYIRPDVENEDSKTSVAKEQWVPLVCELQDGLVVNNRTEIKIRVVAEDGTAREEYTVNVIRTAPQTNTDLQGLKITDVTAEEETEGSGDLSANLKPAFTTGKKDYSITLPYGSGKINFTATLDPQYNSTMQLMSDNKRLEILSTDKPSKTVTVKAGTSVTYVIRVTAEDGSTMTDYSITVTHTAPGKDATLSGIDIVDTTGTGDAAAGGGGAAGGTRLGVDNFLAETKKYTVTVDYVVTSVDVTAKLTDLKASKLTINGKNIDLGTGTGGAGGAAGGTATTSANVKLDYPNTTITIIATAEDGVTTSKYVVTVKRREPSNDARLASLKVDPGTLSPLFVPSKTEYTATIEADDNRVTITAVPTEPHATMTIDGKELKSGEAYSLELVEVNQTVTIVVTAQDGKSQKTYTIRFTNKNLIKKSANADLKSLKLTKGEMSPVFKPSTLDYSFYTTEDTSYVDLYPVPSDPNASVRVMAGTLEIGDHNGNYSQTIVDGENEFTIEVTASDGVTIKTYTAMVYRNDEENMGSLTPLTIEDIDLEAESPIISSDITKRPRVSSEVFQELKNYPDKTLVLQGNDYSLQFAAKDLNTIIPDAVNYNFGMKFSSDSEAEIMDEINSYSGNQGLTPIFVEFNYHGELPGKATYTLSLGKQYANQKLYFHYYNEERGRIDYYGYITTNSQGTFSVPLSRLGTFIITPRRIAGSENKALVSTAAGSTGNSNGNAASEEGVNLGNTEQVRNSKINPDTGFRAK